MEGEKEWAKKQSDAKAEEGDEVYNILPLHDMLLDHEALRFPEVRAAMAALQTAEQLRPPPSICANADLDLLHWLGAFFGFQLDNVRNQRENVVLLLANYQMRLQPPANPLDKLDHSVVRHLRKKVLKNYKLWCSFLGLKSNLWVLKSKHARGDERRELLYACLYLLIWGEAANLRFMPECLCFIFHHMAAELNRLCDTHTPREIPVKPPSTFGEKGFLTKVVTPLYTAVRAESQASFDGKAPHSAWRNYDDMNEYFWSKRCLSQLSWPLKPQSNYLVEPGGETRRWMRLKVGKTGFVEQRSFWNVFRSFDHLWTGYIVLLQAMIIIAWNGTGIPWKELLVRDSEARVLSIFITWAGFRVLQALLDAGMQYSLISRETRLIGFRMILKIFVASSWTIIFVIMYTRMWNQRHKDGKWSPAANLKLVQFLDTAGVFILPEILALVLFILPWIRNFLEKTKWRVFHLLTWWFQTRLFVARGLREGLIDNIRYTLFWVAVLAAKFSFSYYFQIRPMINPSKELLRHVRVDYSWHEFFKNSNNVIVFIMWAPVVLMYLMDTQIWYVVFSAIVGSLLGLLSHVGEIRNVRQFKLRFPFFASAIQFNLMPDESPCFVKGNWLVLAKDMWARFKLRYGLGRPFRKIESRPLEAGKFRYIWNAIISSFREEDIISDKELELMEFPPLLWNVRVLQWPSSLLSNEIHLALRQAEAWKGSDSHLWRKISKNEYRRSAVIECYDSLKHLLSMVVSKGSKEAGIVEKIIMEIEQSLTTGTFCMKYRISELPEVHSRVVALLDVLVRKPRQKEYRKVMHALQNLYDVVIRDLPTERHRFDSLHSAGLAAEERILLFWDAVELPDRGDELFFKQVRRFHTIMSTRDPMNNVPRNLEARRRLAFFSNSLFMNMPRSPSIEKMFAFSVLTPYYIEDVMYSKDQLKVENEDGVSILFYLQKIFPDEWNNFFERMHRKYGVIDPDELWKLHKGTELRLWASYRGQTLARTVRGMMYYQRALEMLAYLESASEIDLQQERELLVAVSRDFNDTSDRLPSKSAYHSFDSMSSGLSDIHETSQQPAIALMKFTYVVTCQIYGAQKARKDPRAEDILFLMKRHEALRIAYVDEVKTQRDSCKFFSVLVKYDLVRQEEVEIYRIQLPGPVILGEGKPENQNHALIFTRGDAVQTIDMNQDNYLEEALKVRNLLQEFTKHHGLRRPQILGIREHVITGSISSLARFMSAQEISFVTIGQRVLAKPLKIRMHYGHPDMFDRLWFLTRGGISKSSRVINISEDIFAGFNCTLRGGNITHHEYIQVGKGRDVGLNQISLFEAKVASGNGEQLISRDVYRLGHRLDFFRMLSFYYSTVGFYINNLISVLTVYVFLWGRAYLALSGADKSIEGVDVLTNKALSAALNQQFLIQLGIFTALPMIVENSLEHGFSSAVWDFFTMQLQLAPLFYTFSMGTKAHFFGRTLLHGGARYRATGRAFVVRHEKFAENYRLYSRSHFIKGIELLFLLIVYESYQGANTATVVYVFLNISGWVLAVSWIMAPFLFNPSGFDWLKTVDDFDDFLTWIWFRGNALSKPTQSWEAWWNHELDYLQNTGFWGKVLEICLSLRFFFFQYGMVYHLKITGHHKSILVYLISWTFVLVVFVASVVLTQATEKYSAKQHLYYRAIQFLVILLFSLVLVLLFELTSLAITDFFVSLLAFVPTGWGLISIALVLKPFLLHTSIWQMVVGVARLYELAIGIFVLVPVAVISWIPGPQAMQNRILFNEAFSRGLQISQILVGKRVNS